MQFFAMSFAFKRAYGTHLWTATFKNYIMYDAHVPLASLIICKEVIFEYLFRILLAVWQEFVNGYYTKNDNKAQLTKLI